MRFFLDHDVPTDVAGVLRREGHEIIELREVLPVRARDSEALAYAAAHGLFAITCNRDDFLKLALQQPNPGVIILIRRDTRQRECAHLLERGSPASPTTSISPDWLAFPRSTGFYEVHRDRDRVSLRAGSGKTAAIW